MDVYYEMLHPANEDEIWTACPEIAAELKKLPSGGYVSSDDLGEEALVWARANGILRGTGLGGC